jgi:hypothetical protein
MANDNKGSLEASYIGSGFGCILGGLVLGAASDLLAFPGNAMLFYFIGGVLGCAAGFVVGRIAAATIL